MEVQGYLFIVPLLLSDETSAETWRKKQKSWVSYCGVVSEGKHTTENHRHDFHSSIRGQSELGEMAL